MKCGSPKISFKDYVIDFARRNPNFPISAHGRWAELINVVSNVPRNLTSNSTSTATSLINPNAGTSMLSMPPKTNTTATALTYQADRECASASTLASAPQVNPQPSVPFLPPLSTNPSVATAKWLQATQAFASTLKTLTTPNSQLSQTSSVPSTVSRAQTPAAMKQTSQTSTSSTQAMDLTEDLTPPTLADFRAPANQIEHNLIIARLMDGGSSKSEAEHAISTRKAAFNKALREFKKEKGGAPNTRRGSKNGKHVTSQSNQNGN